MADTWHNRGYSSTSRHSGRGLAGCSTGACRLGIMGSIPTVPAGVDAQKLSDVRG